MTQNNTKKKRLNFDVHALTIHWSLKESMMSCGLNLPGCILSTRQLIHTHPPSRSFLGLSWIIRARQSPRTLTGASAMELSGTHQPRSTIKSDHSACNAAFTHYIDKNCLITSDHQLLHDLHCSFTAAGASSVPPSMAYPGCDSTLNTVMSF